MPELIQEPSPSPELMERAKALFESLDRSTYASLRLVAGAEASQTGQTATQTAVVRLAGGESLNVSIGAVSPDRLRFEFEGGLNGLRPASVALFTPHPAEVAQETVIRLPERGAARTESAGAESMAAHSETHYSMACDTTDPTRGFSTEPVAGPQGLEAWLEQTLSGRLALVCRLPEGVTAPRTLPFSVRWRDAGGDPPREHEGLREHEGIVEFDPPREGWSRGEGDLRLDADRIVRRTRQFEVRLTTAGLAGGADSLGAEGFLEVVGDDHQVLILETVAGARRPSFEAALVNDEQRRLWNDPSACRMLRFQPA